MSQNINLTEPTTVDESVNVTPQVVHDPDPEPSKEVVFDVDRPQRLLRRLPRRPRRERADQQARDHRVHRPVGLRQDHGAALLQPHERPHRHRPGRGEGHVPRRRPLRPGGQPGGGPAADRDGVPEAEPVPEVDLRERRLRPEGGRREGQHGRHRRAGAHRRRPLGRGEVAPEGVGHGPLRRPAAAAVHRPGHRHRSRGAADGRAVLGARPDRHGPHRGPDAGDQGQVHDRHRHPQHAAGGPGERSHRVLHHRGEPRERHPHRAAGRGATAPTRCSPTRATSAPRTTSPVASDDARAPTRSSRCGTGSGRSSTSSASRSS